MEAFRWVLLALLCLLTSDIVLAQCPSANSQCSCLEQESVIRVYQCDDLGDIAGLPDLGQNRRYHSSDTNLIVNCAEHL